MAACPQCGGTDSVHAIGELADLARMQLGQSPGSAPAAPGSPAAGQGYLGQPQAGPVPGPLSQPQAGPVPGPLSQPQAGPLPGGIGQPWRRGSRRADGFDAGIGDSISDAVEGAIAGAAITAAAGLIGRAIRKRAEKAMTERVLPAMTAAAAGRQAALAQQIAIAERYPALRACLTDQVVFLDGGTATVPLPNLGTLTMAEADTIVGQLQQG